MGKFILLKNWLISAEGSMALLSKGLFCLALLLTYLSGQKLKDHAQFQIPTVAKLVAQQTSKERTTKNFTDYQLIVDRNIFGEDVGRKTDEEVARPVDKQPLKLRLVGVQATGVAKPFAIIEETTKNLQEVFELNEKVFDAAVLVRILAQRVELKYDGSIITLSLEDTAATPSGPNESKTQTEDQTEFNVDRAELDAELEDMPRLLSQARAVPYFRNGQSVGMRLFAIRSDSLYAKLGLKNGDIITNINGQSLSDPTQALKLFNTLKDERSISLAVERGGEQLDLKYSIN